MPDLTIRNARLLLPNGIKEGGLVIEDGKIIEITVDAKLPRCRSTINAENRLLLPGVIDSHVHVRDPGETHKEDWLTASAAAAAGGVTTILDMPNNKQPTTTLRRLMEKRRIASLKSRVDFGLHFGASRNNLAEVSQAENIASVKFYMGPTTGNLYPGDAADILQELSVVSEKGFVASVHAEDRNLVERLQQKLLNKTNPSAEDYAESRPNECAAKAVREMLELREKASARLHFCHVSTKEEIGLLNKRGSKVTFEVTPHHLLLSKKDIKRLRNYSKVNPPLRSEADRAALWSAIHANIVDSIASDHAPHLREEKEVDVISAASGFPGLETMLPLMLNEVNRRNLSITLLSKLLSENPAKIFGIRNKGVIREGYDADLVAVDMKKEQKVSSDRLFTKCGWSPFEGLTLRGWPVLTLVRGNVVFEDGVIERNQGKEVSFITRGA